jgi:hypothetical protein
MDKLNKKLIKQIEIGKQTKVKKVKVIPTWMTIVAILAGVYSLGVHHNDGFILSHVWFFANTLFLISSLFSDDSLVGEVECCVFIIQFGLITTIPIVFYFGMGEGVIWPFMIMIGVKAWMFIKIYFYLHHLPSEA